GLERVQRALPRRVLLLVGERGLQLRPAPALRVRADRRDGHRLVAFRQACRRGLDGLDLGRVLGLLRRRGLLLRCGGLAGAEPDLDARGRGAEAGVALVAGAPLVLADADLRPALVRDHGRGDLDAVVAEQHLGRERAALVGVDAVDDERLAVADAVLL